jgi:hypothetical protein
MPGVVRSTSVSEVAPRSLIKASLMMVIDLGTSRSGAVNFGEDISSTLKVSA